MRIGDPIYHDEQQLFTCNIRQPGCNNVCFNKYTPLSFIRFVAFHMVCLTVPVVSYLLFAAHKVLLTKDLNTGPVNNMGYLKPILDRAKMSKLAKSEEKRYEPDIFHTESYNHRLCAAKNLDERVLNLRSRKKTKKKIKPITNPMSVKLTNCFDKTKKSGQKNLEKIATESESNLTATTPLFSKNCQTNSPGKILDQVSITSSEVFNHEKPSVLSLQSMQNYCKNLPMIGTTPVENDAIEPANGPVAASNLEKIPPPKYTSYCSNLGASTWNRDKEDQKKSSCHFCCFFSSSRIEKQAKLNHLRKRQKYLMKKSGLNQEKSQHYIAKQVKKELAIAYFLQTIVRLMIEISWILIFHQHFSLTIIPLFKCNEWPCPNTVDCFISRPLEKQFVTQFLYGVTLLSTFLIFLDIWYLAFRQMKKMCAYQSYQSDFKTEMMDTNQLKLRHEQGKLNKKNVSIADPATSLTWDLRPNTSLSKTKSKMSRVASGITNKGIDFFEYEINQEDHFEEEEMDDLGMYGMNQMEDDMAMVYGYGDDNDDALNRDNEDMEAEAYAMDNMDD